MRPEALDREQALVLAALREREGAVTYEELRERGVAFPASVVEELELAGLEVERSWELEGSGERRVSAIRLVGGTRSEPRRGPQPASEPAAAATAVHDTKPVRVRTPRRAHPSRAARLGPAPARTPAAEAPTEPLAAFRSRAGEAHDAPMLLRAALVTALGAVAATVVALAIALSSEGGDARRAAGAVHRPHTTRSAVAAAATRGAHATTTPTSAAGAASLEGSATQLEERGHALLTRGDYAQAIPVLRAALRATGRHLSECVEPESESCLTYAYALYDLGRALQLSGQRAAAVPVLERRLQIDNQRATVREALEGARTPS